MYYLEYCMLTCIVPLLQTVCSVGNLHINSNASPGVVGRRSGSLLSRPQNRDTIRSLQRRSLMQVLIKNDIDKLQR